MKAVSWLIMLIMVIMGAISSILKKYAMIKFPTISLSSLKNINIWIQLTTNPIALLTLFLGYAFWGISMLLMQLEDVSKVVMVSAALSPITLLLTIYLSSIIFNETLTPKQTFGLVLLLISMIIGIISTYYTGGKIE